MNPVYYTIARNICSSKGQCVLILGPELSVNKNNGKDYKVFFRDLIKNKSDARYFGSENLFYFKDKFNRELVQDKVLGFYKDVGDPALIEMISRIPFPLIINVCPDKALNETYKKKKIPFSEAYFTKDSKAEFNQIIPIPTKDNPVVYNIFGSIDLDKSLILTHNKLYETFEYLLPEKSLPDNIELFLKGTANSFIFLGFKFDSWQYQLVCHKLKIKTFDDPKINICTPYLEKEEDVAIIMNSSFDMTPTEDNSFQCITNIIEACENNFQGNIRDKNPNGSFSTFVSYAWKDDINTDRENIVDLLETEYKKDQNNIFQLFRDRMDQKFGDSIDSFMTRIGMGKTVIRVISDKYLKSIYCMIESLRISLHNDTDKRVFNIILEDANLNDPHNYKTYWFDECKKILDSREKLEKGYYDDYVRIYRFIDDFVVSLNNNIHLKLKYKDVIKEKGSVVSSIIPEKKVEFEGFLKTVLDRMKQN